jgi:preprotein translocase subunit YajC
MGHLSFFAVLAQADSGDTGGIAGSLIFLAIIGAVFYFFAIRPQRRRATEIRSLQQSLAEGDEIRTAGGILGRIEQIDGEVVTVDVGSGTRMRFARQAIAAKVGDLET